jgi:hypothetical protein
MPIVCDIGTNEGLRFEAQKVGTGKTQPCETLVFSFYINDFYRCYFTIPIGVSFL